MRPKTVVAQLSLLALAGSLGLGVVGCRWMDRASAERHDKNAKEAAKSLNFGAAIDEHGKAEEARKAVKRDPLP